MGHPLDDPFDDPFDDPINHDVMGVSECCGECCGQSTDEADASLAPVRPGLTQVAAFVQTWGTAHPVAEHLRVALPAVDAPGLLVHPRCRPAQRAERWVRWLGRHYLPTSLFAPLDREREEWDDFEEMLTELCIEAVGMDLLITALVDGWPEALTGAAVRSGLGVQEVQAALEGPGADAASVTATLEALAALAGSAKDRLFGSD